MLDLGFVSAILADKSFEEVIDFRKVSAEPLKTDLQCVVQTKEKPVEKPVEKTDDEDISDEEALMMMMMM